MEIKLQQVLTREMKNRSINITSLSRETQIPRTTLHDWLAGRLPSSKNVGYLYHLSTFFEVPLSVLLFDKKEEKSSSVIVFTSSFIEGESRFKITVEKEGK